MEASCVASCTQDNIQLQYSVFCGEKKKRTERRGNPERWSTFADGI